MIIIYYLISIINLVITHINKQKSIALLITKLNNDNLKILSYSTILRVAPITINKIIDNIYNIVQLINNILLFLLTGNGFNNVSSISDILKSKGGDLIKFISG